MKSLKFTNDQVEGVLSGKYYKTWRLLDDKNLEVDDIIQLINSENGKVFATAKVEVITTKHLYDIDDRDRIGHIYYESEQDMLNTFHKFYGPEVSLGNIVKVIKFKIIDNKIDKNEENNTTQITEVKLFTDGGSRGNPGPSATGYAIFDMDDKLIFTNGIYLGITTNNQAEYQAVKQGLEECKKLNVKKVHIFMDSLLVVNQMTGIYKIKNRDLWPIHQAIKNLVQHFNEVSFTHVPRELNKEADSMVNQVLDSHKDLGGQSQLL